MVDATTFFGVDIGQESGDPSSVEDMIALFQYLRPKASPSPLTRIGGASDGAYLVPDDLDGVVACFSPGVKNFKNFEDELVLKFGMNCHMCDFSSDVEKLKTPLIEGNQTFKKKWLDVEENESSITLDGWVRSDEPEGDLILQIDIEGAEYRNILSVSDEVLSRFRVIVMEIHGLERMISANVINNALLPFFEKLDRSFIAVHAHPNNCCGSFLIPGTSIKMPRVLELTYIRRDRAQGDSFPALVPHPLDIRRNVSHRAPLILGDEWVDGERPPLSKAKILEIELDYAQEKMAEAGMAESLKTGLLYRSLELATERAHARHAGEVEVARGKPFWVNQTLRPFPRQGEVDEASDMFFHTRGGLGDYVRIHLLKRRKVTRVVISNRRDGSFDKAASLFIIVSPSKDPNEGQVIAVPDDEDFLSGRKASVEVIVPSVTGRFVFVQAAAWTALHLSNIEIFAAA